MTEILPTRREEVIRLSRIAFIAPDKHLYLQGKRNVSELGLQDEVDIYLARPRRAVQLAKRLKNQAVDVIVSRGGTAYVIAAEVRMPVVEIAITGQDIAQTFKQAKIITGLQNPKIALIDFRKMARDVEALSEIMGIHLQIYSVDKIEDIPAVVEKAAKSDADIIVGGVRAFHIALKKSLKAQIITSGDFSLRAAFLEAQKIVLARKIEKERAEEFKALADHSSEGIISINSDKIIKVFSRAAERLLKCSACEMIGQKIDSVLSFINVDGCFSEGKESVGQTFHFGNTWITFNIAPITIDQTVAGAIITLQDITRIQEMEVKIRNELSAKRFVAKHTFAKIIGLSDQIAEAKRIAQEIALVDSTVLISGESGTGKELFAQSIHNASRRRERPFVAVNCAALPLNLLESELFGYVEGAFTGATKKGKPGLFEMAHRGTLFLDEISEMDKYGQSRLLRVLQEKQVMRLGDDKYIPVDVRIITATNRKLPGLVKDGEFRQDLFYRLKVLSVKIPPLRDRNGDIKLLAKHFLEFYKKLHAKQLEITPDGYEYLTKYTWPGNVRELMYFIERVVVIAKESNIDKVAMRKYWEESEDREEESTPGNIIVHVPSVPEETLIVNALKESGSNITQAAQLLGLDRSTLYRKLKAYKIELRRSY